MQQPDPPPTPDASKGQPPVPVLDLPYYGVAMGSPDRLPTSVRVIGIVGTIFGSLGVLGLLFVVVVAIIVAVLPQAGATIRRSNATATSPVQVALAILNGIVAVAEFAGSIGLLRRAEWGRRLMLTWAVAEPAAAVVGIVSAVIYVIPHTLAKLPPSAAPSLMAPILYASAAVGLILKLILPSFALVYLRRPNVREAFVTGVGGR